MNILPHYFSAAGPGAAVAVISDDGPDLECHGLADLQAGIEITPHTLFDLASVSKTFTAAGIILLYERGLLDFDSPVDKILPQFRVAANARAISIRDLLWHTSGLKDYLEAGMYTLPNQMSDEFVDSQLSTWVELAQPGKTHRYSNTNYFVLARVIEKLANCSYSEFIESSIFEPIGLRDTFISDGKSNHNRIAKGYHNTGYGLPCFEEVEDVVLDTVGDGGVVSSLSDLVVWQVALWDGRVIRQDSLELMRSPGSLDSGERFEYGFGLQVENLDDGSIWCGHGGSWTRSTNLVGRYVKKKSSVIVLSNELMAPVQRISQRLIAGI